MLNKQPVAFNFSQGLDTKTDPNQVSIGKFLSLTNSVFTKGGQLTKRNGFGNLPALPNSANYLTTLNGNLTAIGASISALSAGTSTWVSKGSIQPVSLKTLPLIRNNFNQIQSDTAIASNNLACTVYTELNSSVSTYKYVISDSNTGQNIVPPTIIPVSSGTITNSPRVFLLNNYFIIVFENVISATPHLQFITISAANPSVTTANADIASAFISSTNPNWDGVTVNNNLYIAYNTTTGGQSVKVTYINPAFQVATAATFAGKKATLMSVTADTYNPSNPVIYASFYDSASSTGYTLGVNTALQTIVAPSEVITSGTVANIASTAYNGVCRVYSEITNAYGYDSSIPTNYINANTVTFTTTGSAGTVGTQYVLIRSVGLASKAFLVSGVSYVLTAYQSAFQPSYFLVNGTLSTAASPVVAAKLAYENGGGYLTLGLPQVTVNGITAQVPYLYKDLIEALNTLNNPQQTTAGGIYSQTGINLATLNIGVQPAQSSVEIALNLQLSGGFLWQYDGYVPVEHNFFLWPDNVELMTSSISGSISAQQYYYQAVYSWSDNQGNTYRSAPSIPVSISTMGSTSSNTIYVPTYRPTYKTANPAKIEIYRWSTANQIYYQVTSITAPTLNSTTTDYITFVDTLSDAQIIGNNIIYTNGGVLEDVNAPSTSLITLFDTRLWMVDAEDPNLLWYSKQVIEATPVEMSDLLTLYIAPTTASQGSTGNITAIAPMDDKLIIFKANAMYYINGTGPDNTGANGQYSEPIFITSTVGCSNQQSIVFMPQGLMFQSNKGIWLLGRDLSTQYIGAAVEAFNSDTVNSAVNVPGTNQVRFTLTGTNTALMYDYYYGQWGTFGNVPAVSSTLYQGMHTYLSQYGNVLQETPNLYLDGSNPVLMSFTTSWINLAGLQGFQRAYYFYMLGTYQSPHLLQMQLAYDYESTPRQTSTITPDNYSPPWGQPSPYGSSPYWGGISQLEQWRVFLQTQKCQSLQLTMNEVFDPSYGTVAGAGLTMSGLNFVIGTKKGYATKRPSHSVG